MLYVKLHSQRTAIIVDSQHGLDPFVISNMAIASTDELQNITFQSEKGRKIISTIEEGFSEESFGVYLKACCDYGESFFRFAEFVDTRNCIESYIAAHGESFESMAECGLSIAQEFLGVPEGAMKYMDGYRLCEDVMAEKGPKELSHIKIITSIDHEYIYCFDMSHVTQNTILHHIAP